MPSVWTIQQRDGVSFRTAYRNETVEEKVKQERNLGLGLYKLFLDHKEVWAASKYFRVSDADTLAVLIRFAESQGAKILRVRPIDDAFAVEVQGDLEVTNQSDLRPCKAGVDQRRTYWAEIVEVHEDSVSFLGVFN